MNKIIIAGTRTFKDYQLLKNVVNHSKFKNIDVILSGGARGADSLGERYALENNVRLDVHHALWEKYGKSAGYRRNEEMTQNATGAIIFWDGRSKGTEHMINLARTYNLDGFYYNYVEKRYVEL